MTTPTEPITEPTGATPPATEPKTPEPSAGDPPKTTDKPDEPLGEAGLKALREERKARERLESELRTYEPLKKLLSALNGGEEPKGKSDVETLAERLANYETELATERAARWRAEVAAEKGLTPAQAARLHGSTRDELLTDADALLSLFPAPQGTPGVPKPDPSQGAKGTTTDTLAARIAEAEAKGDTRAVIRLKAEQLQKLQTTK